MTKAPINTAPLQKTMILRIVAVFLSMLSISQDFPVNP